MSNGNAEPSKVAAARAFASCGRERISPGLSAGQQTHESHLKGVARIVASVTDDEDVIAAAWLHDIVADTSVTVGEVERRFGRAVATLVAEVTPMAQSGGSGVASERKRLAGASVEAKTIKLADLIDTLRDRRKCGASAACALATESRDLATSLDGGNARLLERLAREIERCGQPAVAPASAAGESPRALVSLPPRALKAFERAFSADDITEPLHSFDEQREAGDVLDEMRQAAIEIAGVRAAGLVCGYVEQPDLGEGACGRHARPIAATQVVTTGAPLGDVIDVLTVYDWCFVTAFGHVGGVISRRDVQKPAVRMWLFGIITVAEMEATERLARMFPGDAWTSLVPPARLAKARELLEERQRRKDPCRLLDCLQLGDKMQILMSDASVLAEFGLPTPSAARRVSQQVERLRNGLAHAQAFSDEDWPQIVRLARRVANLSRR